MEPYYELIYGYVHCVGRTCYPAGFASTREAAQRWVGQCIDGTIQPLNVPESDPLRWCPVHHCHMKRQRPWFGYRSPDGTIDFIRKE